jgi:photosystem II stability/assembly factor-like uncharacterized protein
VLRDITETDGGRAGRGRRMAVILAGAVVIAALVAVQHGPPGPPAPQPTPAPPPRSAGLVAADFNDYSTGWLVTGTGPTDLWRTSDGGLTWRAALSRQGVGSVDRVHFFDASQGYLLLLSDPFDPNPNYMLATKDGWADWRWLSFPKPWGMVLTDLYVSPDGSGKALFTAETNGDIGHQAAALYSTSDGSAWTLKAQVDAEHFTSSGLLLDGIKGAMAFTDALHGVIATELASGALGVYSTADGGGSWVFQALPQPAQLIGVASFTLAAVGGGLLLGVAYRESTTPATVLAYRSDDGIAWSHPLDIPTSDGVAAPVFASRDIWWVPDAGAVEVTIDGGRNWLRTELGLPGISRVQAVFPIDDRRAWAFAGGSFGPPTLLYETTDGGSSWAVRKPPA